MASRCPQGLSLKSLSLGVLLLVAFFGSWSPGVAQTPPDDVPDVAAQEKQLEEAFQKALAMPEDEPMRLLQTWNAVLMEAVTVERVKELAGGPEADMAGAVERVLKRWHEARPDAAGPDLFRAFRLQQDPEAKRAAILAILERYPDDAFAVWQAINELQNAGETGRARELAEGFASRHPDRSIAYRFLVWNARGNLTQMAEALERWARALPHDPELVSSLIGTDLPRRDPEVASRILDAYFAGDPGKAEDFEACRLVAEHGPASFQATAWACVARAAADPEAPKEVVERATSTLVAAAAAEGDWDKLFSALDTLKPAARARALVSASFQVPAPERCADRVALLSEATNALGDEDESLYGAASSSLYPCAGQPAAEKLFLDLIRRTPESRILDVLSRWIIRVNGVPRGELPPGAVAALEHRLLEEPDGSGLYGGLDLVYEASGDRDKRFELLGRWRRDDPSSFSGDEATELASGLAERGKEAEAIAVLEEHFDRGLRPEGIEALWALYLGSKGTERAERFAEDLIASDDDYRAGLGHQLAARSALERGDFAGAERHYWKALEGTAPPRGAEVELLATIALAGDSEQLEPAAQRICQETKLARDPNQVPECAAELLTRAGQGEAASRFLEAQSSNLPSDLESLRGLASTAEAAGKSEVVERARRRILELDPKDGNNWAGLGLFLEKQGRAEEVADLLDRSRDRFTPPPLNLARAAGRALTAAGEPKRAIEILLEARGALPATEGGEWARSWINKELRDAYEALGKGTATVASRPAPPPLLSLPSSEPLNVSSSASVADLRHDADLLNSGQTGHYDPIAAGRLYARAAAAGDPLASMRLATIKQLHPERAPAGGPSPQELFRTSAEAVRALAEEGDPQAEYLIGTAALIGLGQPVDFAEAKRWLVPAAQGGEGWAWHNLGWMQETGRGFEHPDVEAAIDSYRKAAQAGNTVSMVELARLMLGQDTASADACKEAAGWIELSARDGNARAAGYLSKVLLYGQKGCLPPDPKSARPWLEAAAASHQRGGAYDLGLALVLDGPDETARARGVSLLEQAAAEPDVVAVDTLALLYATGTGVERDPARAKRFFQEGPRLGSDGVGRLLEQVKESDFLDGLLKRGVRRLATLADAGDAAAAALLARLSALGEAGPIGSERIVALAHQGAAGGEGMAMRLLASAHLHGNFGLTKDEDEGERWRRRAAEAGDSYSMVFYGRDLMEGKRVERNVEAGLGWLLRAADTGNWLALDDLARLYDEGGNGIARDQEAAASFKRRLAAIGDPGATGWLLYYGYR